MTKEIDARGLSCPGPVLNTKKALDTETIHAIKVLVDNEAARQNVTRFLESQDFDVTSGRSDKDFYVTGRRGNDTAEIQRERMKSPDPEDRRIVIMITTDRIGHGDDILGAKLMASFLKTLPEMGKNLWRLILLNNGVKLAIEGADTLSSLKDLEAQGITILVCGTCLTHFELLEKKRVGETTNMLDVITALQMAEKVINI